MPPKKPAPRSDELFRSQLDNMINMEHALVKLARLIDWSRFDAAYGRFYHEKGRPGLSTRLMAGLHLLKHMDGLSDETICARWVENPYYQYFCGEQYFRHKLPLDRSSMTRWRSRIGPVSNFVRGAIEMDRKGPSIWRSTKSYWISCWQGVIPRSYLPGTG